MFRALLLLAAALALAASQRPGPSPGCTSAMNAAYSSIAFKNANSVIEMDAIEINEAVEQRCKSAASACTTPFGHTTCCTASGAQEWSDPGKTAAASALEAAGAAAVPAGGANWWVLTNQTLNESTGVQRSYMEHMYPTWAASACNSTADMKYLTDTMTMGCYGPRTLSCQIYLCSSSAPGSCTQPLAHALPHGSQPARACRPGATPVNRIGCEVRAWASAGTSDRDGGHAAPHQND